MKNTNVFRLFAILILSCLFWQCQKKPPAPTSPPSTGEQWYCATIADLQTDQNDSVGNQLRAVGYKDKFWPVGYNFKYKLTGANTSQATMFRQACDEWQKVANVKFTQVTTGSADLRVTFNAGGGAWSYVGTDVRSIPQSSATMNLGWLAMDAYLHEIGHTLGLLHEHQNPTSPISWNEANVIRDLSGPPNNWTIDMIKFNVLNPYPLPNVITTSLDATSIMMYPIPSTWTTNGASYSGGDNISAVDKDFIGKRYPFDQQPSTGTVTLRKGQVDTLIMNYQKRLDAFNANTALLKQHNELMKKYLGRMGSVTVSTGTGIELSTSKPGEILFKDGQ